MSRYIMSLNGRGIKSSHGESIPISLHRVNGVHPATLILPTDTMKLPSSYCSFRPAAQSGAACRSYAPMSTLPTSTSTTINTTPTMIPTVLCFISRLLLRLIVVTRLACVGAGTWLVNILTRSSIPHHLPFIRALYIRSHSGMCSVLAGPTRATRAISARAISALYIYSMPRLQRVPTTQPASAQAARYQNLTRLKPIPRGRNEPVRRPLTLPLIFPHALVKFCTNSVQSRTRRTLSSNSSIRTQHVKP